MNDMVLKLDELGKPAWIGVMVISFILFWPVGLAILAYLIWSGRMGCGWHGDRSRWQARMAERMDEKMGSWSRGACGPGAYPGSTGNRAFDEYREETMKRLEDEQREFQDFLERLRLAKDRAEFDQFMTDRKNRPQGPDTAEPKPAA